MEDNTNIHFRKDKDGRLIQVTETNTKITYTQDREFRIGRLVISYTRVQLRRTLVARFYYFMYNNRLARLKRAVFPAIQRLLARFGLRVYLTY